MANGFRRYDRPLLGEMGDSLHINFVWIENRDSGQNYDLTALQYSALLSAVVYAKPCSLFLHTNGVFDGPYWRAIRNHVTTVPIHRHLYTNGKPVKIIEQEADILKLEVAIQRGGVFVDFDVFFTGSGHLLLDKLRSHECVFRPVKVEKWTLFHMGNFACNPGSEFLKEILRDYREDYRGSCYSKISAVYNGCLYAYLLYSQEKRFQKTVYVDDGTIFNQFTGPKDGITFRLGPGRLNWTGHFNIHTGDEEKELSNVDVWTRNSSFGDMLRMAMLLQNEEDLPEGIFGSPGKTSGSCWKPICSVGKNALVLHFDMALRTTAGLTGFPDLTNIEYASIVSAITFARADLVVLHNAQKLYGPLVKYLSHVAAKTGTKFKMSGAVFDEQGKPKLLPTMIQKHGGVLVNLNLFFVGPVGRWDEKEVEKYLAGGIFLDRVQDPCGSANTSTRLYCLTPGSAKAKSASISQWLPSATHIVYLQDVQRHPNPAFGSIRKLRTRLGDVLRLALFNTTQPIDERIVHKFPCHQ
ncbi:hypothetical protein RvY_10551 [Ramazzottius varieornatus]|uniref:Uncharacterized protein n=1 Tax=Ramazzottius varieornatus TaxID=947166 RepID=A0A1D1VD47_RAMVA|nr:hypothetical protein RvY_10551 [Ramazzottius varieornatus]